MTPPRGPSVALLALGWGTAGGLVGAASCLCWVAAAPAAMFAVRQARRQRALALTGSASVGLGLATGFVTGLYTASLGTLVFLLTLKGMGSEEGEALAGTMFSGGGQALSPDSATGFAVVSFFSSLFFGVVGGLLGAADAGARSRPHSERAYRFEPRASAAVSPVETSALRDEEHAEDDASGTSAGDADASEAPPRDEVPAEGFNSAWTSTAEGGRPRQAAPQPPPPDSGVNIEALSPGGPQEGPPVSDEEDGTLT